MGTNCKYRFIMVSYKSLCVTAAAASACANPASAFQCFQSQGVGIRHPQLSDCGRISCSLQPRGSTKKAATAACLAAGLVFSNSQPSQAVDQVQVNTFISHDHQTSQLASITHQHTEQQQHLQLFPLDDKFELRTHYRLDQQSSISIPATSQPTPQQTQHRLPRLPRLQSFQHHQASEAAQAPAVTDHQPARRGPLEMYSSAVTDHYYATAMVQAFLLVFLGDYLAQRIEGKADEGDEADIVRSLRMGILGMLIAGVGTATWLSALETKLPGHTLSNTVLKATLDTTVWAPVANSAYLFFVPLLEGASVEEAIQRLADCFWEVMGTEAKTYGPYNLLSFALIPPMWRPFSTGFVSMCFAIYLSLVANKKGDSAEVLELTSGVQLDNQIPHSTAQHGTHAENNPTMGDR